MPHSVISTDVNSKRIFTAKDSNGNDVHMRFVEPLFSDITTGAALSQLNFSDKGFSFSLGRGSLKIYEDDGNTYQVNNMAYGIGYGGKKFNLQYTMTQKDKNFEAQGMGLTYKF